MSSTKPGELLVMFQDVETIDEALSKIVSGTLNTSPFFEDGGPGPTKDEAP